MRAKALEHLRIQNREKKIIMLVKHVLMFMVCLLAGAIVGVCIIGIGIYMISKF